MGMDRSNANSWSTLSIDGFGPKAFKRNARKPILFKVLRGRTRKPILLVTNITFLMGMDRQSVLAVFGVAVLGWQSLGDSLWVTVFGWQLVLDWEILAGNLWMAVTIGLSNPGSIWVAVSGMQLVFLWHCIEKSRLSAKLWCPLWWVWTDLTLTVDQPYPLMDLDQ